MTCHRMRQQDVSNSNYVTRIQQVMDGCKDKFRCNEQSRRSYARDKFREAEGREVERVRVEFQRLINRSLVRTLPESHGAVECRMGKP